MFGNIVMNGIMNGKRQVSAKGDRSSTSMMDQSDIKENYIKSLETIRELKKHNNGLQEAVKRLKARSRWPEHVQAAVLSKEMTENKKLLETRIEELSNQCSLYEQQIHNLKTQKAEVIAPKSPVDCSNILHNNDKTKLNDSQVLTLQTTLQKTMCEWKEQEKEYKQQLEEAANRLGQTEERLAQILRLRTMDSAELIRLARASKISTAQLTTAQDENNRLKVSIEQAQTKIDELSVQLAGERERVQQLQEEVTQSQLLRQSLHDTTQELQELKQECDVLRGHLKSVVTEASAITDNDNHTDDLNLLAQLRSQLSVAQNSLEEESAERQRLSDLLESKEKQRIDTQHRLILESAERQRIETLLEARQELDNRRLELEVKRQELKTDSDKQKEFSNSSESSKTSYSNHCEKIVQEQGVQTMNSELDFKPPEVACSLSGDESDRVLAQMYSELESHRELVKTQQHLTKLCKDEMEALHKQLQAERAQYASELSQKMCRLQELQSLLNLSRTTEPVQKPTPAPRKSTLVHSKQDHLESEQASDLKGFEIEIETLAATENSPLISENCHNKLFLEFTVLPSSQPKSLETPGNFAKPSAPGECIPIHHEHSWTVYGAAEREALLSDSAHLLFTVVGEPESVDSDGEQDCEEFGTAIFSLKELLGSSNPEVSVTQELPVMNDDDETIGHLCVTARKPARNFDL